MLGKDIQFRLISHINFEKFIELLNYELHDVLGELEIISIETTSSKFQTPRKAGFARDALTFTYSALIIYTVPKKIE